MAGNEYEAWRRRVGLEALRRAASEGYGEEKIAKLCGLTLNKLRHWKRLYPDFHEALELGEKDRQVVEALYKKAIGYTVPLKKTHKIKRIEYDPNTGKKVREYEELATAPDETHIPADLRAETFWLKNRQRESWSDKPASGSEGGGEEGLVELPEADLLGEEEDPDEG